MKLIPSGVCILQPQVAVLWIKRQLGFGPEETGIIV